MRRRLLVFSALLSLVVVATGCHIKKPPPPPPPPPVFGVNLKLTPVGGFGAITMAVRAGDAGLYLATREGRIYRVLSPSGAQLVLDISPLVNTGGECGLLGMDFSPDDTKLYVHYSQADGTCSTRVVEYAFDGTTFLADADSARPVLTHAQPQTNHKGGSLLFGPDGMLYLSLGDGGGANDQGAGHPPGGNAQSLDTQLGKILRIDPTDPDGGGPQTYTSPPDNPFYEGSGINETDSIWSYGLRNPFRMSFDRQTGDLWVGDVGQGQREEVDWAPAPGAPPSPPGGFGRNFGWNRFEGNVPGPNSSPLGGTSPHTPPVHAFDRSQGDRAVTGGYVYRGSAIPELNGVYIFADFYNFAIRGLLINGSGNILKGAKIGIGVENTASFGEDNNGEIYVLSLSTGVFRIDRA
ncbi:MAG: PQQ-dependent sugar dehydrogenase [Acidimicrobiia bacterium]